MKNKVVIAVFWLGLLCGASSPVMGAESGAPIRDFAVRTWGRAEGLPDDVVTGILQSRDGFLWVGTGTKLARFDGVKFTEFPLPLSDTNAPARITSLCEDSTGKLWIGTQQDGLFRLDETGVVSYRKAAGLVDDHVTSLSADAEGRVWIGTSAGLSRWDGKEFNSFTAREGLTDSSVIGVHVARSGVVWITTRSGMYQFKEGRVAAFEFETDSQGRRPEFLGAYEDRRGNLWAYGDTYLINLSVKMRYNHFRGVDATRIWSLCEGRDGRLWIGTSGRGLVCFDDNNFQPVTVNELHWPNNVRSICEDREGSLWLGTDGGGMMQLLPQPVQVLRAEQGLPPGAATSLATDASGRVFAGFEVGGLFASEEGRFDRFSVNGGMEAQNLIASLCATPDETLWVGTLGNGLYGIRGARKIHLTTLNGLSHDSVPALCSTPDGALWVGTRAGALHRVKQGEVSTYGKEHGLRGGAVTALIAARDGTIWVGTEDGRVFSSEFRSQNSESATPGGFVAVHQVTASAGQTITALREDARGRIWIGTASAGLACWTGRGSAKSQVPAWTTQNGLPDDCVFGVLDDPVGDLWLATGRGVFRAEQDSVLDALVKGEPLRCKLMFASPSIPRDAVNTQAGGPRALLARDGRLWFATPEGLLVIDRSGPDLSRIVVPPVYLEKISVNSKPWEGRKSKVEQRGAETASVADSFSAMGRAGRLAVVSTNPNAPPVRFPADVESVEFEFTAPSFVAPDKLNFRYKLEGQDRDWVNAGSERRARYGRLPYGDYRFRVAVSQGQWGKDDARAGETEKPAAGETAKATDSPSSSVAKSPAGGVVWTEAAEVFAFTVPTPLWRTPIAVAGYIFIAMAGVAGLARVVSTRRLRAHLARLEQQRVVERERMRIAQDMHDDIGSKLTKISFLSERAKQSFKFQVSSSKLKPGAPPGTSAPGNLEPGTRNVEQETFGQIESIATTSRELLQTLDEIVWAVNPRNDSLEHLAAYLSHYAAEYFQNTDVQCELRLPRDLPHVPLSAELRHNLFLAFEEVLNNALKHSGATKVSIEMITGRGAFQINVMDNGRGFDVAAALAMRPVSAARRGGNGMLNMRQRLSAVGGECVVRSSPREIYPVKEPADAPPNEGAVNRARGKTSGDAAECGNGSSGVRGGSGTGTTVTLRIPLEGVARGKV